MVVVIRTRWALPPRWAVADHSSSLMDFQVAHGREGISQDFTGVLHSCQGRAVCLLGHRSPPVTHSRFLPSPSLCEPGAADVEAEGRGLVQPPAQEAPRESLLSVLGPPSCSVGLNSNQLHGRVFPRCLVAGEKACTVSTP